MTFRIRALMVPALVVIQLGAAGPASGQPGLAVVPERAVVSHPAAAGSVRRGLAWSGGGLVARTTGRVFFTLDGVDYACSGSTVGGTNPNVVVTAAHCVSDGTGGWAVNWTFVPGYDRGGEPYGSFTAKTYFVSGRWANGADEDDDVAFVDMRQAKVGGVSRSVGEVAGTQPIAFGYRGGNAAVFGYPAASPFTGGQLDYCQGPVTKDPYGAPDAGLGCAMTEGDSGGPWLSGFNPRTGIGVITGVTSFKYAGHNRTLYSANLGAVAQTLYNRAEKG